MLVWVCWEIDPDREDQIRGGLVFPYRVSMHVILVPLTKFLSFLSKLAVSPFPAGVSLHGFQK